MNRTRTSAPLRALLIGAAACAIAATALADTDHSNVITFDLGWEGWNGTQGIGGSSVIVGTGGNPGRHARTVFNNFGIEWWTNTNQNFLGDLTEYDSVTISIDVKVEGIWFFGSPISRNLILDLRSFSLSDEFYPWVSVWYVLAPMSANPNWITYSVTFDPNSEDMPAGWGGYGDELGAPTYAPILPEHLTFADVLANVEEMAFSTYEPGFLYGFTDFDIRIDNIRIEATRPAPTNPADLTGDGVVNVFDLLELLAAWGPCDDCPEQDCPADLDDNCTVNVFDLLFLLANWG